MQFIAHLHPVLVHLPIGILLLATLFDWLSRRSEWAAWRPAVPAMWYAGAISAVLSCISGWTLAGEGAYPEQTLFWHRWLGVGTAAAALLAAFLRRHLLLVGSTALLLIVAGHLGGSLTHGEGYLWPGGDEAEEETAAPLFWPVYTRQIAPILRAKCESCHGARKQKGGLRLDYPEMILKGGRSGKILIVPGQPEAGELLRRCLLPEKDEQHMPPLPKRQLTEKELDLLRKWIAEGTDFQQTGVQLPPEPALAAAPALLEHLKAMGVGIHPVSEQSRWLSLSFYNLPQPADTLLQQLEPLAPQVLKLNLKGCTLTPAGWALIGKMSQLRSLDLSHSNFDDKAAAALSTLTALEKLNCTATTISDTGLQHLAALPNLRRIYLYQTAVHDAKGILPRALVDTGGYQVPYVEGDTTRLKK